MSDTTVKLPALLESNLRALAKRDRLLANALINLKVPDTYEAVESKSGLPTVKVFHQDKRVLMHSMYDPLEDAKKTAARLASEDHENMLVLFGLGLGYHLLELVKLVGAERKILVVEADPFLFRIALELLDYTKLFENPNIAFVIGQDTEMLRQRLAELFELYQTPGLTIREYRQSVNLNSDFYVKAGKEMKDAISVGVSNYTTIVRHIDEWHSNILSNLPLITGSAGVEPYYGCLKGRPGIIVSAGPSLDKNAELLRNVQGKIMIVACDTALKPLLKRGVRPDVVVSVDGQAANHKHLEGVDMDGIYLLHSPIVYTETPSMFEKRIAFNFHFPMSHWMESIIPKGYLQVGGSVATLAFDFLRQAEAETIIFCGQDLSFPGLKSHAQGTFWDDSWEKELDRKTTIESKHISTILFSSKTVIEDTDFEGKPILTYRILSDYAKWFEYEFERTEAKIINATEGGILKGLSESMTLQNALNNVADKEYDVKQILEQNYQISNIAELNKMAESIEEITKSMKKMRRLGEEARENIRKMYISLKNEQYEKYAKMKVKLDKTGHTIEEMVKGWDFVSHAFQARLWPTLRKFNMSGTFENLPSEEHLFLEKLNIRYQIFKDVANDMLRDFEGRADLLKKSVEK